MVPDTTLTESDVDRARQLRRMKLIATGLFVAAAVVFLIARLNEDRGEWIGYVRATAEAAMVGALADWFAVTALFKHPLGLPIPHTAIVAKRKDEIGRSLGEFVQGNFLTREVIVERIAGAAVGKRLGDWLADEHNADRAAAAVADAIGGVVEVLDDHDVNEAIGVTVERRLHHVAVAPLIARAIDVAVEGGQHQRLFDGLITGLRGFLEENRNTFRERLEYESPWWVPESIDDRVFNKIHGGIQRFLDDVEGKPDHEVRRSIEGRIVALAGRLRDDPELVAKCEQLKLELLDHPEVRAWTRSLWGEMKGSLLASTGDPESELRQRISAAVQSSGDRLAVDADLQAKVDDWVERLAGYIVENYRTEVADLISSTVARWDAADTSQRIELQIGRDLQFIRINGTVVGGLAGLVIHAVGNLLA